VAWSWKLAVASAALSLLLLTAIPFGEYLSPVPVAYLTIYLGLIDARRLGVLKHADLSYGIFLYGFAIQQTVAFLIPGARHWSVNFALAMPLAILAAALSWRFIERPALDLRSPILRWEARYVAWRERRGARAGATTASVGARP
jgi:peptidoglycan/LPS O-acetylase OafA/YrhL